MHDRRTRLAIVAAVIGWLASGLEPAAAQAPQQPECGRAGPGQPCEIRIDRVVPVSGRAAVVDDDTMVTLVVERKSPFESCRNEVKREELPDVAVVPQLLSLLQNLVGSLVLPVAARAPRDRNSPGAGKRDELVRGLARLEADLSPRAADADALQRDYQAELRELGLFYRRDFYKSGVADKEGFERARAARHESLLRLERREVPICAGCEALYKNLMATYAAYAQAEPDAPDVGQFETSLSNARQALDLLAKAAAAIQEARGRLSATLTYLESLKEAQWDARLRLHGERHAKITASVSCTSDITGKPTLDPPIVVTVKYDGTPMMSLTAGVLVSWVRRNSIGIEPVADIGSRPPTAHQEIREHPGRPQALPFTFLNVRAWKPVHWRGHRLTFNAAPGFGVNSNNGDLAAEFFLGGSVGIGRVFLAAGVHAGHETAPANGFAVNTVPPDKLSKVPLVTPWKTRLAFAASYRIPLK